jgi:hypothetical protein
MAGLHIDAVASAPPTPSGDLSERDKVDITETLINDVPFPFPDSLSPKQGIRRLMAITAAPARVFGRHGQRGEVEV